MQGGVHGTVANRTAVVTQSASTSPHPDPALHRVEEPRGVVANSVLEDDRHPPEGFGICSRWRQRCSLAPEPEDLRPARATAPPSGDDLDLERAIATLPPKALPQLKLQKVNNLISYKLISSKNRFLNQNLIYMLANM